MAAGCLIWGCLDEPEGFGLCEFHATRFYVRDWSEAAFYMEPPKLPLQGGPAFLRVLRRAARAGVSGSERDVSRLFQSLLVLRQSVDFMALRKPGRIRRCRWCPAFFVVEGDFFAGCKACDIPF